MFQCSSPTKDWTFKTDFIIFNCLKTFKHTCVLWSELPGLLPLNLPLLLPLFPPNLYVLSPGQFICSFPREIFLVLWSLFIVCFYLLVMWTSWILYYFYNLRSKRCYIWFRFFYDMFKKIITTVSSYVELPWCV